ncbi:MAG: extracellular solute-binding protein [Verrucomicrobia bacterium]|nr:MAG: extracellular solute-binding protein [Verrucomicrobiota bacterium]
MFARLKNRLTSLFAATSPAVWVLLALAIGAGAIVLPRQSKEERGLQLWLFSEGHQRSYQPVIAEWNRAQSSSATEVDSLLLALFALERRLLSAFTSGTPVADLVETERAVGAKTFTGPLDSIGFVDITDRLRAEGLMDAINEPSFAPWTSRGRVFGIPHDVHPVLLAYRADIIEAAGIDLTKVETWAEFFAALRPLMVDEDGDGRPDRYPLNFWATQNQLLEQLILQADGTLFDEREKPRIDSERNAFLLSTLATWCGGPGRVVVDAAEFSASGNTLKLRGTVLASLMPDWLAGTWKKDLPELAGKVKLMPLPAWEKGGRRTSVIGGTMLGIPKAAPDFETAWALAKQLYLDREMHANFFATTTIIPPVKSSWDHPVFHAPDPYFSGQVSGQLFIEQAAHVPRRTGSPYNELVVGHLGEVLLALVERVNQEQISDPKLLLPDARQRLAEAQSHVRRQIERNVFLRADADAP